MRNSTFDMATARAGLLDAILPHVPFDGWQDAAFQAAARDAGIAPGLAALICPRGALDLAVDYHRRGDRQMEAALAATDLDAMRYRDRVTLAVRLRLEAADRELVQRGSALFALPQNAGIGAKLVWDTADAIWRALGDTSQDGAWYTKRMTLSAVYGATVVYWLGDDSPDAEATKAFLDRRIEGVMRVECAKAKLRESALTRPLMRVQDWLSGRIPAPGPVPDDLPGREVSGGEVKA